MLGDRVDQQPFGIAGGKSAAPNYVAFKTGGKTWIPEMRSKFEKQPLQPGESIVAASPGGGGYGPPLARDLDEVERDLNLGYITPERAEQDYGVVIASRQALGSHGVFTLDREASLRRRAQLKSALGAAAE